MKMNVSPDGRVKVSIQKCEQMMDSPNANPKYQKKLKRKAPSHLEGGSMGSLRMAKPTDSFLGSGNAVPPNKRV